MYLKLFRREFLLNHFLKWPANCHNFSVASVQLVQRISDTTMPKVDKKKRKDDSSTPSTSDSDSGPEDRTPAKKAKTSSDTNSNRRTDTKEPTWDLDNNKRVTVREFKGKTYIDIREFYLKDGDWLPGKKGISLQPGQWKKLMEIASEVNESLQ